MGGTGRETGRETGRAHHTIYSCSRFSGILTPLYTILLNQRIVDALTQGLLYVFSVDPTICPNFRVLSLITNLRKAPRVWQKLRQNAFAERNGPRFALLPLALVVLALAAP